MSILASINQAKKYFDLATEIFNSVKAGVSNVHEDLDANTLEEAKAALASSLKRAQEAHDGLDDAINDALAARAAAAPTTPDQEQP